jgi:F-type H+-transporting ATPase subunit b
VRTVFDLGATQRASIQNALNEDFSAEVRVRFETAPGGICGVELTANGQRVGWNIAEYLGSLERKVAELIDAPAAPTELVPHPVPTEALAIRSVA